MIKILLFCLVLSSCSSVCPVCVEEEKISVKIYSDIQWRMRVDDDYYYGSNDTLMKFYDIYCFNIRSLNYSDSGNLSMYLFLENRRVGIEMMPENNDSIVWISGHTLCIE